MEVDSLRIMTALGTFVSAGTVGLFGYHARFFARRWRQNRTARLMASLFFVMALSSCLDVVFGLTLACGAVPSVLLVKVYPLWLALCVLTAWLLHLMVGNFEAIIATQQGLPLRPGAKEWGSE